ncbi:hypothetical protein MMC08_000431 [Hypocenomyce scalaris]|nr:hypothetical protein [Hypocenomyce scalaris]
MDLWDLAHMVMITTVGIVNVLVQNALTDTYVHLKAGVSLFRVGVDSDERQFCVGYDMKLHVGYRRAVTFARNLPGLSIAVSQFLNITRMWGYRLVLWASEKDHVLSRYHGTNRSETGLILVRMTVED